MTEKMKNAFYSIKDTYNIRKYLYLLSLLIIEITWLVYMYLDDMWAIFNNYWPATITMILGSFVAGSTAEGGAFIAFPVFTKILHLSAKEASTFGLMIQSIGMTSASIAIFSLRIKVFKKVILWVSLGGILGMYLGLSVINLPDLYPKLLFTVLVFSFGIALIITRWVLNWPCYDEIADWNWYKVCGFIVTGIVGGIIASKTGAGINILTFIVLTLAFGINEKISVPTSVVIMAINSLVGFSMYIGKGDIGHIWHYWLCAVPVVAIGAPLGALAAKKFSRDSVIIFLLLLIGMEFISTLILIKLNSYLALASLVAIVLSIISYLIMLLYRKKKLLP